MKRSGVLAAALGLAGIAGAVIFAPSAQPRGTAAEGAIVGAPEAAPPSRPTLEVRRAPVPVLMTPRPAVALASAPPELPASAVVAADSPAESAAARAAIELDGYRNAKVLRRGDNGLWYAEAMRGRTRVLLTVDAQGNVAAE
ncbi:MAG: hypothetical protein U1E23_10130 [Reyranellaceae bacterium]